MDALGWLSSFEFGPVYVAAMIALLCATLLLVCVTSRYDVVANKAARLADDIAKRRVLLALWGIASLALLLLSGTLLFPATPLFILLIGVTAELAVCGFAVTAIWLGRIMAGNASDPSGRLDTPIWAMTRGIVLLLGASALPFVGWLLVALCISAGVGSILAAFLPRRRRQKSHTDGVTLT